MKLTVVVGVRSFRNGAFLRLWGCIDEAYLQLITEKSQQFSRASIMGVEAQNDLGGHQSLARKMTWKLPDKSIVFSVQIEVISKKKKGLHSHWDGFSVQRLEYFPRQTCPNDMKLPKNMKSPEILTQNRPKYIKLPKISTPYSNRGGGGGQCPPAPPTPMASIANLTHNKTKSTLRKLSWLRHT